VREYIYGKRETVIPLDNLFEKNSLSHNNIFFIQVKLSTRKSLDSFSRGRDPVKNGNEETKTHIKKFIHSWLVEVSLTSLS